MESSRTEPRTQEVPQIGHEARDEHVPSAEELIRSVPKARVGGLALAALDRKATAQLMADVALRHPRGGQPLTFSSANGEVLSRCASDPHAAQLFAEQNLLSADGEPLVIASRYLCRNPLPERVATTDLFHDIARLAIAHELTVYFFGASAEENARAVEKARTLYPDLRLIGGHHGYLEGADLDRKIEEINALSPDILFVGLGVPREQEFCRRYCARLSKVGLIKTSGGLFNFLSGQRARAPIWMQRACLEWLWRLLLEPRRLFWRYAWTNQHALLLLLLRSS